MSDTIPLPATPELDPDSYEQLTFAQLVAHMASSSFVLTAGTLALRFSGFLLIPLYWRYLDPADYGILALAEMVKTFVAVFLGLGLSQSITGFYHVWPKAERPDRIGCVWLIDWASSFVVALPLIIWGGPIFQLFVRQVPFDPYLRLAVCTAALTSLASTPLATLRIQEQSGRFVALGGVSFAAQTAMALLFVVALGRGSLGFLEAQVVGALLMVPVYVGIMWRRARVVFKPAYVREAVRFSLPLVPSSLTDAIEAITGRFVLEKYVSLGQLGFYAIGESLAGVVRIVFTATKTAWLPFEMRAAAERGDARSVIGRMATLFVAAIVALAVAVSVLSADLVWLVGVDKYRPVASLVPLFVIPNVVLAVGSYVAGGIWVARKTEYSWVISLAHLTTSIAAHVTLIPAYGVYGAIIATGIAFLARATVGYAIAQRFYPIAFEWGRLMMLLVSAVIIALAARAVPVPPSFAGLLLRGAILGVYLTFLSRVLFGFGRLRPAAQLLFRGVRP